MKRIGAKIAAAVFLDRCAAPVFWVLWPRTSSSGKSSIGPDQVRTVLSKFREMPLAGDIRLRHHEEDQMPESGGGDCTARKAFFDPCILEKTFGKKFSRFHGTFERAGQTAGKTLAKRAPSLFRIVVRARRADAPAPGAASACPKRSNALLAWSVDMKTLIISRRGELPHSRKPI